MNADGSNADQLHDGQAGSGFLGGDEAAWSPDGTKILYGTQDTSDSERDLLEVGRGGVAHKIVDNRTLPTGLNRNGVWSRDGSKIAFAVARQRSVRHLLDQHRRHGLTNLSENAAHDLNPAWSHDGTKIAFATPAAMASRPLGHGRRRLEPDRLTSAIGHDQLADAGRPTTRRSCSGRPATATTRST